MHPVDSGSSTLKKKTHSTSVRFKKYFRQESLIAHVSVGIFSVQSILYLNNAFTFYTSTTHRYCDRISCSGNIKGHF